MNLRANPESKFLLKHLLIGLFCLGFAALSLYDAQIAYPKKLPRLFAWENLLNESSVDGKINEADVKAKWAEIAKENDWSRTIPDPEESVKSMQGKILFQYVFLAVGLGIGVPSLVWYFRSRNTWLETTEDGIRSSNGQEVKITQIQSFDKRKWEKKGIAVLHYQTDGMSKKFVIDDLKYQREPTDAMVRWIESHLSDEMIVNGKRELLDTAPE